MDQNAKVPSGNTAAQKAPASPDEGNARQTIISEAARLFARLGYDGTSMREIARASDIQASSAYHHFQSKDALFLAVHESGIDAIFNAVARAIANIQGPWDRLEAA